MRIFGGVCAGGGTIAGSGVDPAAFCSAVLGCGGAWNSVRESNLPHAEQRDHQARKVEVLPEGHSNQMCLDGNFVGVKHWNGSRKMY